MAPNTDGEIHKVKAGGINVKRMFKKFLSSKPKIVGEKVKNNDEQLVFDALPNSPREGNKLSDESLPSMSTDSFPSMNTNGVKDDSDHRNCNEKTQFNDTSSEFPTVSDDDEENADVNRNEKKNKNDKKRRQQSYTNHSKPFGFKNCPSVVYQTNMTINGGTGIHIGDNKTNVVYYNASPPKKMNETPPRETSPAVKALLKSQDKLESAHLNVLSEHFGTNWEKIGLTLGFTAGELDCIKEKNENQSCQEKGFQMLHVWCRKTGKKAKVGVLCRKLWYGSIDSARDAVEQLSLKIDDI